MRKDPKMKKSGKKNKYDFDENRENQQQKSNLTNKDNIYEFDENGKRKNIVNTDENNTAQEGIEN